MSASQMALLILLPLYVVEVGHSPAFAAAIVGVRGIGLLCFDLPAGALVARYGERPVLLAGLLLIIAGTLLLALGDSVAFISVAAWLIGAGFAAWMLGRQSYIADVCENHEVGRAIAGMAGLQRVGIFIGPATGGMLVSALGFDITFLVGALVAAFAGGFVFLFARGADVDHAQRSELPDGMLNLLVRNTRIFATAGVAALILQFMRAARQLLVPLVGQSVGLDVVQIGTIYSLSAAIDMSLFYPVGVMVDRWGRKWSVVPSMVLFSMGLAGLGAVSGYYSLLLVGCILGLANGIGTGIVMILGSDLAQRSSQRGRFLGLWRLFGDSGMALAPMATGFIVAAASLSAASLAVAAVGFMGAGIALWLVPETLSRPVGGARRP